LYDILRVRYSSEITQTYSHQSNASCISCRIYYGNAVIFPVFLYISDPQLQTPPCLRIRMRSSVHWCNGCAGGRGCVLGCCCWTYFGEIFMFRWCFTFAGGRDYCWGVIQSAAQPPRGRSYMWDFLGQPLHTAAVAAIRGPVIRDRGHPDTGL